MKNINLPILAFFALIIPLLSSGQSTPVRYEVEAQAIGTTNKVVPFWMRSNQYGSIPLAGVSGSFIGRAYKDYADQGPYTTDSKLVDWAAGFQGRANLGSGSNLQLIEAYAKLRVGMFQMQAGRTRDVMGLNGDTSLSSGNFAVSGNALGIPKVEISIPEYWTIPWFDGLFAVKGNFAHGWVGEAKINSTVGGNAEIGYLHSLVDRNATFFHQKSLYGRVGKPHWRLKLYGGISHQAYWGNEKRIYGNIYPLSNIQTFNYVFFGKAYGNSNIPRSKIGNQLGSIDFGFEYRFDDVLLKVYRQNFYDIGAISKLANIRDGLNGVSVKNKFFGKRGDKIFDWKGGVFEFLYSKNQAGELWSTTTNSGAENYYNNFHYLDGWTYKTTGLGNPLFTPSHSAKSDQASDPANYFINNRVIAFHAAFAGRISACDYILKATYSTNFGTYRTSSINRQTGRDDEVPAAGLFQQVNQLSIYTKASRKLNKRFAVGYVVSWDAGDLLNNSFGAQLSVCRSF